MKALVILETDSEWSKLYFDQANAFLIELNRKSIFQDYIETLQAIGVKGIDVVVEGLPHLSQKELLTLAMISQKYEIRILNMAESNKKGYGLSQRTENRAYSIVIQGIVSLPPISMLKRLIKKQQIYVTENRDNIDNNTSAINSLESFYNHMIKTTKTSFQISEGGSELFKTLVSKGAKLGKSLYLHRKIVWRDRIIDPFNCFYVEFDDPEILRL